MTTLQKALDGREAETAQTVVLSFLGLLAVGWLLFAVLRMMHRSGYEVETLAFFLSTLGFAVIASDNPANLTKQLICLLGGIVIYLIIGWSLRDLSRAKKFRYLAAVGGMLLLLVNLVFGQENNGARNWISLGGISFQPSELVKLCFLYVGASTMDRIITRRNLFLFIVYSAAICGCLCPDERLLARRSSSSSRSSSSPSLRSGSFATVTGLRGHGLCRCSGRSLPAAYPAPLCNMGPCVGICLCGRLPADARDDVHRLRRPVWPRRRQTDGSNMSLRRIRTSFCFSSVRNGA